MYLSQVNYIDQVSDLDMNQKWTFFGLLWYFKNLYLNYTNKKLLSVYKSLVYLYIYSLFHSIGSSLWLTDNYNFLKFIQSNNTYSWHHIRWIYAVPFSSEYPFLDVHRSNVLESNLMSVYVIGSYVHIATTSKDVVTKKRNCC